MFSPLASSVLLFGLSAAIFVIRRAYAKAPWDPRGRVRHSPERRVVIAVAETLDSTAMSLEGLQDSAMH